MTTYVSRKKYEELEEMYQEGLKRRGDWDNWSPPDICSHNWVTIDGKPTCSKCLQVFELVTNWSY